MWLNAGMNFADQFLGECAEVIKRLGSAEIEKTVAILADVREKGGRVFVLGVGGSAAMASHFVNDLRKLAGIEAYAPTDNVAELTARVNDEGWASCFSDWLQASRLNSKDAVFIFSVGGGDAERNISLNLVRALDFALSLGARALAVVGRDGGYARRRAQASILIPVVANERVTPLTEAFHAVIGHLLVSHPALQRSTAKWESASAPPHPAPGKQP